MTRYDRDMKWLRATAAILFNQTVLGEAKGAIAL
jgi:hypothetical protein